MNGEKLIELKKVFETVKNELVEIKSRVKDLDLILNEGRLVPQEMSVCLQELLKRHSEQSALLVSLGAELSMDMGGSVAEIETELDRASETERIASLRDIVLDFFRLTAEAENVRKALDASKKVLAEKCRTYDGIDGSFIEPYKTVVANAKSNDELSDDDYDTIQESFDRSVLRAADKKQLFIDETADVNAYLDDSCELLRSKEPADKPESEKEPITDGTTPKEGTPENGEAGADASSGSSRKLPSDPNANNDGSERADKAGSDEDAVGDDNAADSPAETEDETPPETYPLGNDYSGYADSTTIEYKDVSAKELGAKQFISMCKQKLEALDALFVFSHQIFISDEDLNKSSKSYMSPSSALCDYLLNHGYLTKVTVNHVSGDRAFYMLTSKAWECYAKPDVIRYFKSIKHVHIVPEELRIRPVELTPVIALRLELIHDYFCKESDRRNYGVFPDHPDNYITANRIDDSNLNTIVCAGVFDKEKSAADLETLKAIIEIHDETKIRIIVMKAEDIALLSGSLDLDESAKKRTRYCIHGDPDTLYDGDGRVIGSSNSEAGDADETADATDNKPAEHGNTDEAGESVVGVDSSETAETIASGADVIDTEPVEPENTPSLSAQIEEYSEKGRTLLCSGKFPEALVMFRALSAHSADAALYYKWLAYALDDPAFAKKYKYSELQTVFSNQYGDADYDALALSAYLRMFFSEDAREEHYYVKNCAGILSDNSVLSTVPQLKDCIFTLSDMFGKTKKGFDPTVINLLLNENGRRERVDRYSKKAVSMIESKLEDTNIGNNRIRETRRLLFGPGSMLYRQLEAASSNRTDEAGSVSRNLREFLDCEYEPGDEYTPDQLSDSAVSKIVDGAWDSAADAAKRQKSVALIGAGRNNIVSKTKEIICTCLTWASLCEAAEGMHVSETEAEALKAYYSKASQKMNEARETIASIIKNDDSSKAGLYVLLASIDELTGRLSGNTDINRDAYFYVSFLKGTYVELSEDYMPYVDLEGENVAPLNLCKRVFEQGQTEDTAWKDVLGRIFTDRDKGLDFGHAELIKEYLAGTDPDFVWPPNYDIKSNIDRAKAELDSRYREFVARLEMADNYGWVEDSSVIDRITADIERRRQHCTESSNYGFYFRTMNAYINKLEHDAEMYKASKLERLRALRIRAGEEHPIFGEIERLISEHMYSVAQDYMDQYEKNGETGIPESTSLVEESDALSRFIEKYGDYLKEAKDANRGKLSDGYRRRHRNTENSLVRTGIQMLEAWPRSEGSGAATRDKVRSLFEGIGLPVKTVESVNEKRFRLFFEEQELTADYPHPIGAYGSEMFRKGLNVFFLFGNQEADTMDTAIRRLITSSVDGASVIIADTQLSLADKKKLAKTIKQGKQNLAPYLILDRVMMLHLAEQPKSERWNVFLKCSLPFHYLNPFTENSTLEICPDMFIGRRQELDQVLSPSGANIIYGGRQLGKTALLHHARRLFDHRSKGQWAVFVDLKPENAESAANTIYRKLQDEGFLPESDSRIDWTDLAREITNRIRTGKPEPVSRFLLLLDEADNFLLDSQKNDYLPVVRLKQIQVDTENRFKFVLAGLHNVIKFYDNTAGGNSAIAHLGTVTIKPLPFREASELLEKPLSYLGFRLKSKDASLIAQILSSTNYYPGLIQFYASRLVRSVCQGNYGNVNDKPPYLLQESQILQLLKDPEFVENIREKFMITLGIDQNEKGYYNTLANILAYCYYTMPEYASRGYSTEQVHSLCKELDIHSVACLKPDQVTTLLKELTTLNVLRMTETDGIMRFVFNRTSFRHMLGDEEQIENAIQEIMEKEYGDET